MQRRRQRVARQQRLVVILFDRADRREARGKLACGDQVFRRGVVQHQLKALVGITGIERQIGSADADNSLQRQREPDRARQGDGDDIAGGDALRCQLARQRLRLLLHFAVGQALLPVG